ncbi:hypothetical protein [uncultured Methylobacterium sp.]|uniref:hypothetical protein n=1 Tax=uncultured Methylobacterium sp. TaxID=157278 RepID=UPI0035CC7C74
MNETDPDSPAGLVRGVLASLMKAALISDDHEGQHWRGEAARQREALLARGGDLSALKLDGIWWMAVADAETPEMRERADRIEYGQPKTCPFTLDALTAADFDVDRAVQHLRETAATG